MVEPFQAQVHSLYLVLGKLRLQKDPGSVVKDDLCGRNEPTLVRRSHPGTEEVTAKKGTAISRKWQFPATIPHPQPTPKAKLTGDAGAAEEKMQVPPQSDTLCLEMQRIGVGVLIRIVPDIPS